MRLRLFAAVAALAVPEAALAGPPFLTDYTEPTGAGHCEIFALLFAGRPHSVPVAGPLSESFKETNSRGFRVFYWGPFSHPRTSISVA